MSDPDNPDMRMVEHYLETEQERQDHAMADDMAGVERAIDYHKQIKGEYPNLAAILVGTVSGQSSEWPMMAVELLRLLDHHAQAFATAQRKGFEVAEKLMKEARSYVTNREYYSREQASNDLDRRERQLKDVLFETESRWLELMKEHQAHGATKEET